jgi:hypothetical protein
MSAPAFAPERGEIWFADGNSGFYNLHMTNGVWPFTTASTAAAKPVAASVKPVAAARPSNSPSVVAAQLAATGGSAPLGAAGAAIAGGLALLGVRRRVWLR